MKTTRARSSKVLKEKRVAKGKKKAAFKDDIKKVAKIAKDFVGEAIARKRSKDDKQDDVELLKQQDQDAKKSRSKAQGEAQIQFFYTNDKYFTQFDDKEIVAAVQQKYPDFMREGISDSELKKAIVVILQDTSFMNAVLEFFNMSIQDFFKFIFRCDTSIFKGPYLSKLQRILRENGYDV